MYLLTIMLLFTVINNIHNFRNIIYHFHNVQKMILRLCVLFFIMHINTKSKTAQKWKNKTKQKHTHTFVKSTVFLSAVNTSFWDCKHHSRKNLHSLESCIFTALRSFMTDAIGNSFTTFVLISVGSWNKVAVFKTAGSLASHTSMLFSHKTLYCYLKKISTLIFDSKTKL